LSVQTYKRYCDLHPKSFDSVARFLAEEGLAFDLEWRPIVSQCIEAAPDAPIVAVYLAESLRWTRHATRDESKTVNYIAAASSYIAGNDEDALAQAEQAFWRFGRESLSDCLLAMRRFYELIGLEALPTEPSELVALQERLLEDTDAEKRQGGLKWFGPWLFLGVFKIHLTCHQEPLDDPRINDLIMPLGSQAVRGLEQLARDKIIPRSEIPKPDRRDRYDGATSAEDFARGIADAHLCMDVQRRLASSASSSVPRINNGLYMLGEHSSPRS
jgi:hypothetical protein